MYGVPRGLAKVLLLALIVSPLSPHPAHAQAAPPPQPSPLAQISAPMIVARLEGNLNTKNAKVGEPVAAKTLKDLRLKDLDIPKGSKLVGSVAAVESAKAGNGTSSLAIKFDQVQLKNGAILRTQGQIVGIAAVQESIGLGYESVLGRGGVGSTPGLDPTTGADVNRDTNDIPLGSSVQGVALALHLDANGATELRGAHRDIKFDSTILIKVALFKGA
ncbi:MAG TPA: hypothetical protein VL967_10680 [Terracidiphilus sp.]|nr:hypothetical protein [Terracidiphilus sp.]